MSSSFLAPMLRNRMVHAPSIVSRTRILVPCRSRTWSAPSAFRVTTAPRSFLHLGIRTFAWTSPTKDTQPIVPPPAPPPAAEPPVRENIYTLPNALTLSRIASCPVIGWALLTDRFYLSTSLLVYASLSDAADGWIARRFNMRSVLGTILDPAADKTLMTTLVVALAYKDLLPGIFPLAALILGRDVLLSLTAFYIRYTSLPAPKTFSRYWDFSIPSAEVRPTQISKYNTALQLGLMFSTAVAPVIPHDLSLPLTGLQYIVAGTTIWSGLSYIFTKDAIRIVASKTKPPSL